MNSARPAAAHQFPSVRGEVVAIVGGHAVAAKSFAQTFHFVPVELKAGAHDQPLVFHHSATLEDDSIILGFEGSSGRLDPFGARRDQEEMVRTVVAGSKTPAPTNVQPG